MQCQWQFYTSSGDARLGEVVAPNGVPRGTESRLILKTTDTDKAIPAKVGINEAPENMERAARPQGIPAFAEMKAAGLVLRFL